MKIQVTKSSLPPYRDYCKEIKSIWKTFLLTNCGPKHNELEEKMKSFLKVKNVTLFTNGHLALENALALFDFPYGSEVITTPFTFASTTNAIVRNGLIPVFCDINFENFTIDAKQIASLITDKTVAIVPVHVYGNVCDVETIDIIAKQHNLVVIYDAAHAFGVRYKGKDIANFGDLSMFSFHATKVFNTIEGGALCFSNDLYEGKLRALRNFGIADEDCIYFGGNAKMSEFQAAMGLCNLKYHNKCVAKRKKIVEHYRKRLNGVPGIRLSLPQSDVESNYAYFPVLFDGYKKTRDKIQKDLMNKGIFARKYFWPLTSVFKCSTKLQRGNTPVALYCSENILTLPLFTDLTLKEVDLICDIILED